jgi:hypothetical protein
MMEREELGRRWREAQFHAMAIAAEHQPAEDPQQDSSEPTAPTLAQIMRVKPHSDIGPGMTEDDRMRHFMGLK